MNWPTIYLIFLQNVANSLKFSILIFYVRFLNSLKQETGIFLSVDHIGFGKYRWRAGFKESLKLTLWYTVLQS